MSSVMAQISSPATPVLAPRAPVIRPREALARYAPAIAWCVAALACALVLRASVDPTTLFLVAVAGATWSGGWRSGLLAAALATLAVDYFFVPPTYSFAIAIDQLPRLGVFVLCATAVSWASDARRVTVERALRDSERQLHALFDEAAIGIALVNESGHAFKTNRALRHLFGYSASEFRAFSFTKITHPARVEPDWNLFTELAHGKRDSYRLEKRCIAKDGHPVWANLTASLVRDDRGGPLFGIVVVEDISDRKRAEEELKRSEAFLAEGQRLTHTGSWGWNVPSGRIRFSKEALRILDLDPDMAEPAATVLEERVCPEDRDHLRELLANAARRRRDHERDVRFCSGDGAPRTIHIVARATVNALGEPEYMGVLIDVTDHQSGGLFGMK
jgi:PAS domain S-box-containing protein